MEAFVADPESHVGLEQAPFFILHLLAQFREKRAYPLLMRLVALDPDVVEEVLGDAATETLPRLAISLFDGDPRPLQTVIENPKADEHIRGGLFEALAYLAKEGRVDRKGFEAYLLESYARLEPQGPNAVWFGWQAAVSMLGLRHFKDLVRRAFASGKVPNFYMRFEDFEADLKRSLTDLEARHGWDHVLGTFDDTIGELSQWHGFSEEARHAREIAETVRSLAEIHAGQTVTNPQRRVGRNDPCPCGSGRKFKKCCLQ